MCLAERVTRQSWRESAGQEIVDSFRHRFYAASPLTRCRPRTRLRAPNPLPTRVLVLSAGTGAACNLIRSLQASDGISVVGCHADRFVLKKSPADRNYLTPPSGDPAFGDALCAIVEREHAGLVIPGSDEDVRTLSGLRERLG